MADDSDERIEGGIDEVGLFSARDPEFVEHLVEMQKMYNRVADEIRGRKNVPFSTVMKKVQDGEEAKKQEAEKALEDAGAAQEGPQ